MPRTIRFHLDEHVAHAVADGLRRLGVDVTTADGDHLAYTLAESRVLFTQDDDFLALAATGSEHAGLAYCRQNTRSIGEIIRALELIWEIYEPDEIRNRVEFL